MKAYEPFRIQEIADSFGVSPDTMRKRLAKLPHGLVQGSMKRMGRWVIVYPVGCVEILLNHFQKHPVHRGRPTKVASK